MKIKKVLIWILRLCLLVILFNIFFIGGSLAVSGLIPDIKSEPGLVAPETALMIMGIVNTLLIIALIKSSRWSGFKLALGLSFSYYGVVTFMMQIETWYFLSDITVGKQLLSRLFLMGMPVAFVFIPLSVWILGKWKATAEEISPNPILEMPIKQWVWKFAAIALSYLLLYWCAGYFIAWQNPELRAFYGSPGPALPFVAHTLHTLMNDPWLFLFQIFRAILWTVFALPIIFSSRFNAYWTAIILGLLLSVPQNIGHILENPLMPIASVRISHMIETASSTFIFGLIIVWLLHRRHSSIKDLFGIGAIKEYNS